MANTLPKPGFPFVGVVLPAPAAAFAPAKAHVNTGAAWRSQKAQGTLAAGLSIVVRAVSAMVGRRTGSIFFGADGVPVVTPHVLSKADRDAALTSNSPTAS